ncbi:MAG: AAA family ATPase [Polyangiaceae bacterium]
MQRDTDAAGRAKSSTLVGRDRELSALLSLIADAVHARTPRAAIVTGDAGIGKSRLARELAVQAAQRGISVWVGRGDPAGRPPPFGVLGDMIHRLAQIGKAEPLAVRRDKLRERLGRHLDPESLWESAAVLGEAAGISFFDGAADDSISISTPQPGAPPPGGSVLLADLALRAWEELLSTELAEGPILLLIDDAERADPPSMRLFEAALRNLTGRSLAVIALARPDLSKVYPGLFAEYHPLRITLGELTEVASRELLSALTKDRLAPATLTALALRSGGNPFVLEGLALAASSGAGDLPDTVLATATARFNAASPETRRLVRAASVIGEVVAEADLAALLEGALDAAGIEDAIAEACALELLERRTAGIAFRSSFVREVAYASFTEEDRARAHLLAAHRLAAASRDPAILAWHFELGGARAKAVEPYRMAALRALAANDFEGAIARCKQAEACGAEGPVLGEVVRILADAHLWRGQTADTEREARRAMGLLAPGSVSWVQATTAFAVSSARLGNHDALHAAARDIEALAMAKPFSSIEPPLRVAQVVAMARLSVALVHSGDPAAAEGMLGRLHALRVAGALDDLPFALGHTHRAHAIRAHVRAELVQALLSFDAAAGSFDRARALRDSVVDQGNAAFLEIELGLNDEAEKRLGAALAMASRLGLPTVTANMHLNQCYLLTRRGAWIAAVSMGETALQIYERQASARSITVALVYLTRTLAASGEGKVAEQRARRAALLAEDVPLYRAYAFAVLSAAELTLGRIPEAVAAAEASMTALSELGTEEGEAFIRLTHVEALRAAGRIDEARAALFEADAKLSARAARIPDPAYQKSFLHNVPEHARTVQMAESLGVGPSSRARTLLGSAMDRHRGG